MIVHEEFNNVIVQGELLLFHTLWNTTNDNMFIIRQNKDGDFIIEKTNNAQKINFNLVDQQIDGVSVKKFLDATTYKNITEKYKLCIKVKKPITYEEKLIIDNKSARYWQTTIIPIIEKESNITRIFGISREITELKLLNENLEIEVKKRTEQLKEALIEIKKISITDKLTGLYNRHHLDSLLVDIQGIINRYDTNYGLILVDIDDFKNINDTYGHQVGDVILKELSILLKNSVRETDTVGRWGGEEFLIILPSISRESIITLSNNIREKIEKNTFSTIKNMTASFGSSLIKKNDNAISFISRTDKALYKAKRKGKNRVEIEE